MAAAAAALAPSMAVAAAGASGPGAQPAAVTPGAVLSWGLLAGTGRPGDLGDSLVPARVKLPADTQISEIQGGCRNAVALTSKAGVVTWGDNSRGQAGTGIPGGTVGPAMIRTGASIVSVRAGCDYDLALTDQGQVLAWGANDTGQLGIGVPGGIRSTPVAGPPAPGRPRGGDQRRARFRHGPDYLRPAVRVGG